MTRKRRWAAASLLVATPLALAGCGGQVDDAPAPPLAGTTLSGDPLDLADHRGEVVLVTVWASWCGPCRAEVPVLNAALERHGDDGLTVVGLNFRDNPDAAEQFVDDAHPDFPSIEDRDGSLGVTWGVSALPQSFVVDRDGVIVERLSGAVDDEWIEETVAAAVAE